MKLGQLEIESGQFGVGDFEADWIDAAIKFSADFQSGLRCCVCNQINDHLVTDQGSSPPILGNVGEHAMLNFVPLAGARWEVANMNGHPQAHSQFLQCHLPQAAPAAVAATAVGRYQKFLCIWVSLGTHLLPPSADGLHRELRRIVIDAHTHPALVLAQIEYAIGNDFAQVQIREIMHIHLLGLALGLPLAPSVLELAYEFLLLGVHGYHRLAALLKPLDHCVDVLELSVAIWMCGTFLGLAVTLQAIASIQSFGVSRDWRSDGAITRIPFDRSFPAADS